MKPFDRAGEFQALNENVQLAKLTVRNAGITIFAQSTVFGVQLVGTLILARILAPSDFGLVTMVTTFGLLLASFGLAGFTEAVIQVEKINHALASNLFWINITGGIILSVAFGAAGSLLARFYGNPHIANVATEFSFAIFFSIAPVLHLSLLKRAMRFRQISLNDILGRVVYVLVAIGTACLGWKYWALVTGAVVQSLVVCIATWVLCPWLPGLPRRVPDTGKMLRYATSVYGRYSLNYCNGNNDNLLVGWRFGAHALGIYKKAYDLFILPCSQLMSPILAVVVTTLSRKKNDEDDYGRYLLKGLSIVAFVGMAAGAILTLVGKEVVQILLGPKWGASADIFRYFAPGIGFLLIYQTTSWIHLSLGTTGRWLRWTAIELAVTGILFLLGLRWGPAGVAGAWTVSIAVLIVPAFWYAGRPIRLSVASLIGATWRYAGAAFIGGLACTEIQKYTAWLQPVGQSGSSIAIARLAANSGLFALFYLGAIVVLFGSTEPLHQMLRLVPDLLPGVYSWRQPKLMEAAGGTVCRPVDEAALQEVTVETIQ